jgi:VanZ family protein
MAVTHRWKLAIVALAVYWPTLFILAHIPIPQVVQEAGVSDKALHFLAYATLVFLLWIALNPERKVCWRRATVWWVLLTVVVYGIIDELLQSYVGRTCDAMDFVSDLAGALTSCIILTYLTFWPASLVLVAAIIFGLTNIARQRLADVVPVANAMFHLFSYAVFTVIWVCYRRSDTFTISRLEPRWLITTLTPPIALLVVVKGYSLAVGREFPIYDVILSLAGIAGAVAIWAAVLLRQSANQGPPGPDD